ncbi:MAG: hypothetical protein MJA30_15025, partial [Cytophagales bacterium]|nr:hypothetical protein [Cytophagales bacterium]
MLKKAICLTTLLIFCYQQQLRAQNLEQDSLALVQFYQSTNGDSWVNNGQWLTGTIDTWNGVGLASQRVDTLRFLSNNLTGTFPGEITQLSSLRVLSISDNPGMSGRIPASISNLSELRSLTLSGNGLDGTIPPSLGDLTNLQSLSLNELKISGTIPGSIYSLSRLRELNISSDSLQGQLSNNIGNLTQLTFLSISGTQISGSLPSSLANIPNLNFLSIFNNRNLGGVISSPIWGLENLEFFIVANNAIEGSISSEISSARELRQLFLSNNRFEGVVPTELSTLDSLESVGLNGNRFTGLPDMSQMESLSLLAVQDNFLTFEDIEPNLVLREQGKIFTYAPQKPVYDSIVISAKTGSRIIMKGEVGGSANVYQWFKDGEIAINGTTRDLTLGDLVVADSGSYYSEITSAIVTDLTLERNPVRLQVTENEPVLFCQQVMLDAAILDTTATYLWSTGAATSSITVDEPGDYTVIVETSNYVLEETFVTRADSSDLIPGRDINFEIVINDRVLPRDQALLTNGELQFVNTSQAGID